MVVFPSILVLVHIYVCYKYVLSIYLYVRCIVAKGFISFVSVVSSSSSSSSSFSSSIFLLLCVSNGGNEKARKFGVI